VTDPDDGPLRERLVDTGVRLLEAEGLADLTLRSIARAAGVSHGAPRRHFPTFTALLAAIAERGLADLTGALRPALEQPGPVADRVTRAAEAYLDFARRRPHMFTLVFRHDLLADSGLRLRERSLPILDALTAVLREEAADDGAARAAALAVWTHTHGVATLTLTRALDLAATPDQQRDLLRAAVRSHLTTQ
jgi:AcrR family transcriptional regulator